jgi:hypothetical protein
MLRTEKSSPVAGLIGNPLYEAFISTGLRPPTELNASRGCILQGLPAAAAARGHGSELKTSDPKALSPGAPA